MKPTHDKFATKTGIVMEIFTPARVGLIITLVLIIGCDESIEREPPETPSEVLNEFVREAPYQFINLDDAELFEVELTDDDILFDINQRTDDEVMFGQITHMVYHAGTFTVYDMSSGAIYQIGLDGKVSGPLSITGSGPGEHRGVGNLRSNNRNLYASSWNLSRLNRYDHNMSEQGSLNHFGSRYLDLNSERIVIENRNSNIPVPQNPEQGIIAVTTIDSLTDILATILPRIIPVGYQPFVYNSPRFSINSQNNIAASYYPLPWIFLFGESFNNIRTLILEYSIIEDMDIPEMDFFKPIGNEGFGGSMPITEYKLMDNGDLFLIILRELIHLKKVDGEYVAAGRYNFSFPDFPHPMLHFGGVPEEGEAGYFYSKNREYLFRFKLKD